MRVTTGLLYLAILFSTIQCANPNKNVTIQRTHNCYHNDQSNIDPYYDYAEFGNNNCDPVYRKK